jgi:hypothetical protein
MPDDGGHPTPGAVAMYTFTCPNCARTYQLRQRVTITQRRCRHCGYEITPEEIDSQERARKAPPPPPSPEAGPLVEQAFNDATDAYLKRQREEKERRQAGNRSAVEQNAEFERRKRLVMLGSLALVAIVLVGLLLFFPKAALILLIAAVILVVCLVAQK